MAENGIMDAGYKVFFGCLLYNSDATEVGIVVRIEDAPRNAVKMTKPLLRRLSSALMPCSTAQSRHTRCAEAPSMTATEATCRSFPVSSATHPCLY